MTGLDKNWNMEDHVLIYHNICMKWQKTTKNTNDSSSILD